MMTFVTCSETSCPFNSSKTCMAKELDVGLSGECLTFGKTGPKSVTENYVNVSSCACHKCDHWELDEATNMGKCGASTCLHFFKTEEGKPVCKEFKTQIGQPGFVTNV